MLDLYSNIVIVIVNNTWNHDLSRKFLLSIYDLYKIYQDKIFPSNVKFYQIIANMFMNYSKEDSHYVIHTFFLMITLQVRYINVQFMSVQYT